MPCKCGWFKNPECQTLVLDCRSPRRTRYRLSLQAGTSIVTEKFRYKRPPLPGPLLHPPSLKLWRTRRRRGRGFLRQALRACLEIRPADVAAEVTRRIFCEDRAIFRLVTSAATISKHALRIVTNPIDGAVNPTDRLPCNPSFSRPVSPPSRRSSLFLAGKNPTTRA